MWEKGIFEMGMLLCFGAAWPVSIYKSWTTKRNAGKSLGFLIVVFLGYVFGILNKIFHSLDYVLYFYLINLVLVGIDIVLYIRNNKYEERMGQSIDGGAHQLDSSKRRSSAPYSK
jgi:hypothetical protein